MKFFCIDGSNKKTIEEERLYPYTSNIKLGSDTDNSHDQSEPDTIHYTVDK